ncbi:MAG TPA: hypothetical protein VKR58_02055, partial [Aquella sp.]|nr:hypothetical protein [Aquella sp.]
MNLLADNRNAEPLNVDFDLSPIMASEISEDVNKTINTFLPVPHRLLLDELIKQIKEIDFRAKAGLEEGEKLQRKHLIVITIDAIVEVAKVNGWRLCRNDGQTYIYNGAYWKSID